MIETIKEDYVHANAVRRVLEVLPKEIKRELVGITHTVRDVKTSLSEVRLRALGVSYAVAAGRSVPLVTRVDRDTLSGVVHRLCHEALYAYRDTITMGYISMEYGVRVGVVGQARYEAGKIVGISDVSSLVFRIPTGKCDFAEELYRQWSEIGGGLLICSSPAGGKTTALRAIAGLIGSGPSARRVAVVDERCEFIPEDYATAQVDLIRGYKRDAGIDLAIRTMSSQVLIADEIGGVSECEAMLNAAGAGVTVVATAHAGSPEEALRRKVLMPLFDAQMFSAVAQIYHSGRDFGFELRPVGEMIII